MEGFPEGSHGNRTYDEQQADHLELTPHAE